MKNSLLTALALVFVLCISACSTSNVGTVAVPDGSARNTSFSAQLEEGMGTFSPVLAVEQAGGLTAVKVYAEEAVALEAAYVNLAYDSMAYSPDRVEFGGLLGDPNNVLTFALTNVRDVVPLGTVQIAGRGAAVNGAGLLATVYFRTEPFVEARSGASVPDNGPNAVDDLKIIDQGAGSVSLAWTEHNVGDYDNNGEVSISDLTPIALLYGQVVATASDPMWADLVDGDGNGEINSADITPIGLNFGNIVCGYVVYTDEAGTNPIETSGCTCEREDFYLSNRKAVEYSYLALSEDTTFTVRPVEVPSLVNVGILSNVAEIVNVPGPPDAPTNLSASPGTEHQTVVLTWLPATHEDVAGYEIERKLTSDPETNWAKIQDVGAGATGYTDLDATFLEVSYDYRVRARDLTGLFSVYSNVDSAIPYFVPLPGPPQNLTSTNEIPTGNAIELNWEPNLDGLAQRFFVFCKGPNETEFAQIGGTPNAGITTYLHTGLSEGDTYEYYVTSVGVGAVQSVPSNTTSNTPSGMAAIEITSLTTDKWTHYANGGDATASTFTVETNVAPDSVEWDCSLGNVTGSGSTVTYKPPAGSTPQVVTVTCTVHKGAGQDVGTLKQYLTNKQIYTLGSGGGKHIEIEDYPSIFVPNAPYQKFSSFFEGEGHVVIVTHWGTW